MLITSDLLTIIMLVTFDHIFSIIYLVTGFVFCFALLAKNRRKKTYVVISLFGLCFFVSESLEIIPEILLAWNIPTKTFYSDFGTAQIATSIVITIVFVMFYLEHKVKHPEYDNILIDIVIFALALVKIITAVTENYEINTFGSASLSSLVRNTPLLLMGFIIMLLSVKFTKKNQNSYLKYVLVSLVFIDIGLLLLIKDSLGINNVFEIVASLILVITPLIVITFFIDKLIPHHALRKLE